jgi:3-oxoacyl-[acyl-carrier-protein] synthase II
VDKSENGGSVVTRKTIELKRVVVTGLGAITPVGNTVPDMWEAVISGKSGAGPITRFDASGFKTRFACEVKGFDPRDHFDSKESKKYDPYCQYSLVAADEAIRDALLNQAEYNSERAGVIWASGMGGLTTLDEQLIEYALRRGKPRFSPFFIPKIISNMASGMISITHGLCGINFSTVSACASSANAVSDAFNYIRLGKADFIITGGAEAVITESAIGGFNAMKALSERNDHPQGASRPYDIARDGFVMGEGAGAIVLEELEHAVRRGARIYAEVLGVGFGSDAYHMSATHPEGRGAFLSMRDALQDASIEVSDVDYINAHATSTPLGDLSEITAFSKLFGEHLDTLSISATKSMTGHLLGAAGAIEAIICIKSIADNIVPPTINTEVLDDSIPEGMDITLYSARNKKISIAMNNAFGFGGHCSTNIFSIFYDDY